jgi:hypothetical protein
LLPTHDVGVQSSSEIHEFLLGLITDSLTHIDRWGSAVSGSIASISGAFPDPTGLCRSALPAIAAIPGLAHSSLDPLRADLLRIGALRAAAVQLRFTAEQLGRVRASPVGPVFPAVAVAWADGADGRAEAALREFLDGLTEFMGRLLTARRALLWELWRRKSAIVGAALAELGEVADPGVPQFDFTEIDGVLAGM